MVEPIIGNWNHESSRVRGLAGRLKEKGDTIDSSSRLSSMLHTCPGTGSRTRSKDAPYSFRDHEFSTILR